MSGTDTAATGSSATNGRAPAGAVPAPLVSVVIPCLDEASAIAGCVSRARATLAAARADFVIGTRLRGRIHPGGMSWLHRYVGNPLLNGLLNVLYGS